MIREEAINNLKDLWNEVYNEDSDGYIYAEALDMAIEALTNVQNMHSGDSISRVDVMGAVQDHFNANGFKGYDDGQKMMDRIKALPSAEAEWIPCSERLPNNKTYVLTTIQVGSRQPHARSGFYHDGFFHNDNGDTWEATDREVIAWMSLPEPYREDCEA